MPPARAAEPFFRTPRLEARAFTGDDVAAFAAYRSHPEVERYQSWEGYTLEQGRALIASMEGLRPGVPGAWYQLALEEREGRRLVGDVALRVDGDDPRLGELGVTLAPGEQGKGYGTEAVRGLLGYAFGTLRLHRVVAVTDARNRPAAALLERAGMRREGHFVENVFFKGAWGSELLFAVLRREWPAVG